MKQLVIVSGKGGTGKTTLTASFAVLAENKVICDCDVDAANLFILLNPQILKEEAIITSQRPIIDKSKCIKCGKCEKYCRFDAITEFQVDNVKCEGCGVCKIVCPVDDAIVLQDFAGGEIFTTETEYGPFFYGKLKPGAGNTGKLVTEIRKRAFNLANERKKELILIDGSPGIGCPVIASVSGTDLALIVTEPTLSGEHDLIRIAKLTQHFKVKTFVCINKSDINPQITERIEKLCKELDIKVIGKIPYDPVVTKAMMNGKPVVEYTENDVTKEITKIWRCLYEDSHIN